MAQEIDTIDTIYGRFTKSSKRRLDLTYDYENSEIQALRKIAIHISPSLVLDIGANIGVYSVFLSNVESVKRVFAFEPAPATYEQLECNFDLQTSKKLNCRKLALSESSGTAEFEIFGALAGNNAIKETGVSKKPAAETIAVKTAMLDEQVDASGEIFVCKIDVEGHELQVLTGAVNLISNNTGVLQIECFGPTQQLDALLQDYGYDRIFRMKQDYYYTNIADSNLRYDILDTLFAEVAAALSDLKDERRRRRQAIRNARDTLVRLRFGKDPVCDV